MKTNQILMTAALSLCMTIGFSTNGYAQFGKKLMNGVKSAATNSVSSGSSSSTNNSSKSSSSNTSSSSSSSSAAPSSSSSASSAISGASEILYVSATTGGARNDGKSPEKPMKDLQKAIDAAGEDGTVILVAEGNYLGNMDRGSIANGKFGNGSDVGKYVSIYGGYSTDFKSRDVTKYITKIQPTGPNDSHLFSYTARRKYGYKGPVGSAVIDGLTFDFGENNLYCAANVNDDRTGTPNKDVLTGRFIELGASPQGPKVGTSNGNDYALVINVEGNIRISNCVFVNCRDYGIEGTMYVGHLEICNNIFVACRYAAVQVGGGAREADIEKVSLDFHHNTVLFSWTRTKDFGDMGQGFRFMNGIRTIDCHHNIFGCNSRCGVERCRFESNKQIEALKVSNLYDNYYFANKMDLEIAGAGGKAIPVSAARIEEVDEKTIGPKYENNKELPSSEKAFVDAIDQAYLKGFMSLKIMSSQTYDANSAANQANRALGLNQQGTEIIRPTMYCNKYPWEKAKNLFGKVNGYGAQKPDNKMVK